ncbi:signal transduction histidine kinase/DNA-binding response OmpR family regulator/methyl-accepting chemotaxis protein [Bacillus mesophilus]|uniref:Circadian input-output histidine kinase CikA n=1 Tax=Bacillus mesophilus TaxID=1808955 RepID=A0A6M0QCI5_9BACI|nr:response regulator [Bacillus mesophilus]MBM7663280.1 signal transduction histidine kinase/DNA-binding response OmpR family regulator/methyl-accepting chemotaxis protein [Bacillus mesophilus]NEY74064.1 response regulator [Bacillus mesophilus]
MDQAKKLYIKSILLIEGISYIFLIPLATYVVFFHGELLGEKLQYSAIGLAIAVVVTFIHGLIMRYYGLYKPFKLILSNKTLSESERSQIKLTLLKQPQREAYGSILRWTYGIAIVIFYTSMYVPIEAITYIAAIAAFFQSALVNFINNYFITERLMSEVLESPTLSTTVIEAKEYKEFSLIKKTILMVVGIFMATFVVLTYLIFELYQDMVPLDEVLSHFVPITIGLIAVVILSINLFNYSNKKSLKKIQDSIQKMSEGDLSVDLSMITIDELGRVCNDLYKLNESQRDIAQFIYSEIQKLQEHSNSLSVGQHTVLIDKIQLEKLEHTNNFFEVTDALHDITKVLQELIQITNNESYIREGKVKLTSAIQDAKRLSDSADKIIKNLASHVNATIGILYVADNHNTLRLTGRFAHSNDHVVESFQLGEGLIGQVAEDKNLKVIHEVPDNHLVIHTGLLQVKPKEIIIVPCVYNGETKAVIVLGTLDTFMDSHIEYFTSIGESIALTITSHQANEENERLLEESRKLTEELQKQQEVLVHNNTEIEQMNKELEQQTRELRKSESLLETKQQELENINEELKAQTIDVEKQRDELNEKNEELYRTKKLLEEKAENLERANQYKSEFLANMSHELRTPLNSIIILSKILFDNKQKRLSEKEMEYSETIFKAAHDLLDLINEILDLAKVEAGMMDVHIENVNLRHFIEDLRMSFKEVAVAKGVEFIVDLEEGLPSNLLTDSQRLKQIIKNLLSNAFKFTHAGSVSVQVYKKDMDSIAFSVRDTGIGIPEDKQGLIFKEFSQVDGTTNRKYGGTGLGLSISDKFAKLLGGEIQVTSKVNQGSAFTLVIPENRENKAKSSFVTPLPTQKTVVTENETPIETVRNKLLLIIDDDPNFVKVISDMAKKKGFKCISSLEGEKGIELARNFTPDAIILDIKLPGIDGWEVMKQLNENEKTRKIPVHFVSSMDSPGKGFENGAIGYITKPVTAQKSETLFEKIMTSIKGKSEGDKLVLHLYDSLKDQSLSKQLAQENISFISTSSLKEASELVQQQKIGSILLDNLLDQEEVIRFIKRMKRDSNTSYIPVISFSKEMMSSKEEELRKYVDSIIIQSDQSSKRLMNEINLFLHHIEDKALKTSEAKQKYTSQGALLANKTILVVDDDMRNVFALTSVLESHNMNVIVGRNGKDGIQKLKESSPIDMILMDIMMPEMDGYETMRHIRSYQAYEKLPIIALTAKAMKGDRQKCLDAGANDYMAKPVDTDQLLSLMKVWLQR